MPKKIDAPVETNGVHVPDAIVAYSPAEPVASEEPASANGTGEKRPPAHVVRIGALKVCVWINATKEGRPFYGITTARVYRNGDGECAQSYSYGRNDLLPLSEALRLVFLWIAANPLTNGDDDVPF